MGNEENTRLFTKTTGEEGKKEKKREEEDVTSGGRGQEGKNRRGTGEVTE